MSRRDYGLTERDRKVGMNTNKNFVFVKCGNRERRTVGKLYGRLSRTAISKTDVKKVSVGRKFRRCISYESVKLNRKIMN